MPTLFLLALLFFTPQGSGIKGKVVADIPDQRKALPGVVVTVSGDRDFALEPVTSSTTPNEGLLLLQNSARSRYRELQAVARSVRLKFEFVKY